MRLIAHRGWSAAAWPWRECFTYIDLRVCGKLNIIKWIWGEAILSGRARATSLVGPYQVWLSDDVQQIDGRDVGRLEHVASRPR